MIIKSKKEVAKEFLTLCAQEKSREAFGLYAARAFKHLVLSSKVMLKA